VSQFPQDSGKPDSHFAQDILNLLLFVVLELWNAYVQFETEQKDWQRVNHLHFRMKKAQQAEYTAANSIAFADEKAQQRAQKQAQEAKQFLKKKKQKK
jgi:hypothetical protein